jgi:hypothetical protein
MSLPNRVVLLVPKLIGSAVSLGRRTNPRRGSVPSAYCAMPGVRLLALTAGFGLGSSSGEVVETSQILVPGLWTLAAAAQLSW